MIIAVDASGGEYAPHEIVKGAIKAAHDFNANIALVGNKSVLHVLAGKQLKKLNLTIVNASQTIGFHEHPMEAIRNKPQSSIAIGINLLKEGKASAFVSAGNTGAVLCASLFNLGKIDGVERPALASLVGLNRSAPAILIDAGANADCRPNHLLQFARLGNTYAQNILGIDLPRVGLLSNGEEDTKGNRLTIESHQLLKKSELNFIGNIEGNDIAKGTADVIVSDGFTGNIVIKTVEGLGDSFIKLRQSSDAYDGRQRLRGRALLADVGLGFLVKGIDFREYGGACLLGVKGNVIVSHGRSQARAIKNAIGLAKRTAERDICQIINEVTNA
ncbi:MAG TPA: phosphate acyltransferase PlsX [Dehalococcoidia bacterium]|nr:phosphate acyltransferase PlsX [Dehalococcoidia bacterium]